MRISNLRVISNARKAYQQNAYLRVFTLPSANKNFCSPKVTKRSMNLISSDSMTHSAKVLDLRIR